MSQGNNQSAPSRALEPGTKAPDFKLQRTPDQIGLLD